MTVCVPLFFSITSLDPSPIPVSKTLTLKSYLKPLQTVRNVVNFSYSDPSVADPQSLQLVEGEKKIFHALEQIGITKRSVKLLIRTNPGLADVSPLSLSKSVASIENLDINGDRLIRLFKKNSSLFVSDLLTDIVCEVSELPELDRERIGKILFSSNPSIVLSIRPKIDLLSRYDISKSDIASVLNRINLRSFLEAPIENLESVLAFLRNIETPNKNASCVIVRHPSLLLLDLESDLRPVVHFFQRFFPDSLALTNFLYRFPIKRWFTIASLELHIDFLKSFGFSVENIRTILRNYPQIFTLHIERKIKPKIEFLRRCGLKDDQIVKTLTAEPSFFGLSFDGNITKKTEFLTSLGFRPYSVLFARVLGTVTRVAVPELMATVRLLMVYGLSRDDIVHMCERQPHVLKYTCQCLKPKIDYLIGVMGLELRFLVDFPTCLGYSLEHRIKPRHEAMTWLVSKGLVKENYSVNRMLSVSNRDFLRLTGRTGYSFDSD